MAWIDLGEPKPRSTSIPYARIAWPEGARSSLPAQIPETPSFSEVSLGRRSRRSFAPLHNDALGALLALTCKTQRFGTSDQGLYVEQRPCPSAGALHPIHLLIADLLNQNWRRYDARAHALVEVPSRLPPRIAFDALTELMEAQHGTLLVLAAEPNITAAKYACADSLIWRDAGAILGTMGLAAEALQLHFCPLGTTGDQWASNLLEQPGLVGVGAAILGTTPD